MSYEIKKVAELEYSELVTLAVIENDDELSSIFKEEIDLSYSMLITLAKEDKLSDETKELLFDIFDGIISTSKRHSNNYVRFGGVALSKGFIKNTVEEIVPEVVEAPIVNKPTKEKKANVLPKWYGKERLIKEITLQGGVPTPTQRAMLELNELKNIYSKLLAKGIKDLETGSNILSEEDCRTIESIVVLAKRRLNKVLTKKK